MMTHHLTRQILALLWSAVLCCTPLSAPPCMGAQASERAQMQAAMVRPDPKRAEKAAERGDKAQAAGRNEEALTYYQEAASYAPQDVAIVGRGAALRSKLVRQHVGAAEKSALEGNLRLATEELNAALRIDPQNTIVTERLAQMKNLEDEPNTRPLVEMSGVPKLEPQPTKRDLNLRGDTKTLYEQVASLYGVKAAFDPDLAVRNVRLRANDVDFYTAASLLGAETATFWRPLNPTLFFVAADTPEKRRQYAVQAEQVFYLPAAASPEEMTELLRIVRDITGITHIELDSRSRTITVRDTPERLALTGSLIRDAEKARGEIMLEAELLEVDRGTAMRLGLTPPSSASLILLTPSDIRTLTASKDLANLLTNAQKIFAGKGFSSIPPFVLVGGGLSTFILTAPGTAADFSESLSLVQSGRQVLLRAQNGKPATFFVGDRYPVTLSLLSGTIGTGGSLIGVPTSAIFPETTFLVGNNPVALAANSFTGGSLPDLAVANQNDNSLTILQNQDHGNFTQLATSPILLGPNEKAPSALASGTFRTKNPQPNSTNGPPPDLVVANSASNTVSVLLGNVDANGRANGTFTEAAGSPFAVGKQPSAVLIADFNGDGFQDFAVANQGDNSISVFGGKGDGTFTQFPGSPFLLNNTGGISEKGPVAMISANFRNRTIGSNNSAEMDLAIVNRASNNVTILLASVDRNNNVVFTEAPGSPLAVQVSPVAIATADLNGDTVPDLAVVNQGSNSVTLLLGNSSLNGTFSESPGSPLKTPTTAPGPAGIVIANFSNSAVPELAVTNKGQGTLSIFASLGGGIFQLALELNTPAGPGAVIAPVLTSGGLHDVAMVAQGTTPNKGVVAVLLDSASFANGSTAQRPYPGSEFIDLGVKVKATPTLHDNDEVTLQLEFEIRALSGSNINGIPIITNRTVTQTVRVKEEQPTLLTGLMDQHETRGITGLPGFAELPGIGYAFGGRTTSTQGRELMILITPRRLRSPDHQTRTILAGHGERGAVPSMLPSERVQPP
jgi:tetratricopeptide (TPR) repeat protein